MCAYTSLRNGVSSAQYPAKKRFVFALQLLNGYTREVTKHERSVRIVRIFRGERRDDSSILDLDCLSNLSSASVTRLAAFASFFITYQHCRENKLRVVSVLPTRK